MSGIYQHVRKLAPDTHLIVFSHVAATQFTEENLAKASEGISYGNASVGFHCYDSNPSNPVQFDHAKKLRALGYPMICTEFNSLTNNNDPPIRWDLAMSNVMRAEDQSLSWIGWGPSPNTGTRGRKAGITGPSVLTQHSKPPSTSMAWILKRPAVRRVRSLPHPVCLGGWLPRRWRPVETSGHGGRSG